MKKKFLDSLLKDCKLKYKKDELVYLLPRDVENLALLAISVGKTLDENRHLTDGDDCSLKALRDAYLKIDPDWIKN